MAQGALDENRDWRRWARIALALSALLHLLFLAALELAYIPDLSPPRYRIRLEPLSSFTSSEPFPSLAPDRLPIPAFSPEGEAGPGQAPSFGMEGGFAGQGPGPGMAGVEGLPLGQGGAGAGPGEKAGAFVVPALPEPDLDARRIEKLRREAAEREQYARFHLLDADTTDERSQRRSRARQIVERAIAAMGGREALGKIREMKARVWVEATDHCTSGGVADVPSYAYPVAFWHFTAQGEFTNLRWTFKISLDPEIPNPLHVLRNPCRTLGYYYAAFDSRWSFPGLPAPRPVPEVLELQRVGRLREQGEAVRWHFIDHFLGEGVSLSYITREHLSDKAFGNRVESRTVDAIQVVDERYGSLQEAFFDQETGLLLGTLDALTPAEERWFRTAYPRRSPPVWATWYGEYRVSHGVLVPHCLVRRNTRSGGAVKVLLRIAYNGEEPDQAEPDVSQ